MICNNWRQMGNCYSPEFSFFFVLLSPCFCILSRTNCLENSGCCKLAREQENRAPFFLVRWKSNESLHFITSRSLSFTESAHIHCAYWLATSLVIVMAISLIASCALCALIYFTESSRERKLHIFGRCWFIDSLPTLDYYCCCCPFSVLETEVCVSHAPVPNSPSEWGRITLGECVCRSRLHDAAWRSRVARFSGSHEAERRQRMMSSKDGSSNSAALWTWWSRPVPSSSAVDGAGHRERPRLLSSWGGRSVREIVCMPLPFTPHQCVSSFFQHDHHQWPPQRSSLKCALSLSFTNAGRLSNLSSAQIGFLH